jgi:hypothetical protein
MYQAIPDNWQPSDAVIQLLAQNGVSRDFVLSQVLEFRIYWSERGTKHHAWSSKFAKHCMHEYRRYEMELARGQSLCAMSSAWRPSQAAYAILMKDGIAQSFAESMVPEFIIYWVDRGEVTNTWNSKFIAHVRFKWQNPSTLSLGIQKTTQHSLVRDLTDKDWAAGYVRGDSDGRY